MLYRALSVTGLALAFAAPADARPFSKPQETLEVTIGGAIQPRVTYGIDDQSDTERFGFGLRRGRLRTSVGWSNAVLAFDIDLPVMTPVGLYMALALAEGWKLRAGYFAGAQPRGYVPTSMTAIDGIDRSPIATRWAGLTIGSSGRDLGLDVTYANDYVKANVWLHSGYGGLSRGAANFRQSLSSHSATGGVDRTGLALSGALAFTPQDGLEIGGFASHNIAGGAPLAALPGLERTVTSWGAHVYYGARPGSQLVRLKAEVLGLSISGDGLPEEGTVNGPPEVDLSHIGASGTAALGVIPHGEIFARFEVFDEDDGNDLTRYLEAGIMFSVSAMKDDPFERERLTLSYGNAVRGDDTDHALVLQGQWLF